MAKDRSDTGKIIPLPRRPVRINVGLVIFAFIFVYLVYTLIHFSGRKNYAGFSVGQEEEISRSANYEALLLRQEKTVRSRFAGFLDAFVQEGARVSAGSVVTTVDELGVYSEAIREAEKTQSLSEDSLLRLKERLSAMAVAYDPQDFWQVYTVKSEISSYFLGGFSTASLSRLEESMTLEEFFHREEASTGGLVAYYLDGFEDLTAREVTADDFKRASYTRENPKEIVTEGDFLYKLIDSENWSAVIPVTAEEAALYNTYDRLPVTFLTNQLEVSCPFTLYTGADGGYYLELKLHQYLIQFLSDRYTRIRISLDFGRGYKIPKSTLTEKAFYIIPKSYGTYGGGGTDIGFITETYSGSEAHAAFVSPTVYRSDEDYYYVDTKDLTEGTVLVRPDSDDRFTVRMTTALRGVYQINKGFTVFRLVEIVSEAEDYCYVRVGTPFGINTFDQILLNSAEAGEGQILN